MVYLCIGSVVMRCSIALVISLAQIRGRFLTLLGGERDALIRV